MSHCERLITRLEAGPITPMEAWNELGIYRLGARVFDLREKGLDIRKEMVSVSNRFGESCRVARYRLESSK